MHRHQTILSKPSKCVLNMYFFNYYFLFIMIIKIINCTLLDVDDVCIGHDLYVCDIDTFTFIKRNFFNYHKILYL
jgi:hypothetical protein